MAVGNSMSARDMMIITEFCLGTAPSEIDRQNLLMDGTSRNVVTGWWADDKEFRNGGIENILGQGWRESVRKRARSRRL